MGIVPVVAALAVIILAIIVCCVPKGRNNNISKEEYAQFYGAMNTMNGRMVTMRKDGLPYEEMGYVPPPNRKLPPVPGTNSNYNTIDRIKKAGGSIPGQDEDISPYATFHLLGMREEGKNGQMQGAQNFQTMPANQGQGPITNPNTPIHQKQPQQVSQTMNPRR